MLGFAFIPFGTPEKGRRDLARHTPARLCEERGTICRIFALSLQKNGTQLVPIFSCVVVFVLFPPPRCFPPLTPNKYPSGSPCFRLHHNSLQVCVAEHATLFKDQIRAVARGIAGALPSGPLTCHRPPQPVLEAGARGCLGGAGRGRILAQSANGFLFCFLQQTLVDEKHSDWERIYVYTAIPLPMCLFSVFFIAKTALVVSLSFVSSGGGDFYDPLLFPGSVPSRGGWPSHIFAVITCHSHPLGVSS